MIREDLTHLCHAIMSNALLGQSLQQITVMSNFKQTVRRIAGLRKIDLSLWYSHSLFSFLIKQASPETYFR